MPPQHPESADGLVPPSASEKRIVSARLAISNGRLTPALKRQELGGNLGTIEFYVLVVAYLVPGLIGHDPWKQDETYIFGMIDHLLRSGDWVVPMVAGEPFMEKPPLYAWIAAILARLWSPWLPLHDGARLATGLFMVIAATAIGWTARQWWGEGYGRYGVLALLSCLGMVFHAHLMLTDVPLLSGVAVATYGFILTRTRAVAGGIFLGVGAGMAFLAKGLLGPGVLGLTGLLLPLCFPTWRSRRYCLSIAISLATALPCLLIWPIALYTRSPALFFEWLWLNNIGRFIGFSVPLLGAEHSKHFWLETLPWFTFPALPLALLTLWRGRKAIRIDPMLQLAVVMFSILMSVLWLSASARSNYAIPLLVPISLLAVPAMVSLSPRIDQWWDWSAKIVFGLLASALWIVWSIQQSQGKLSAWHWLDLYLPLEYVPSLDIGKFLSALLLTILAIMAIWRRRRTPGRGVVNWMIGITLCWALVSTLWLNWIDYAKSYRVPFTSLQLSLPPEYRCVASQGLGESERAMLRYFLGLNTYRREIIPDADCDVLLIDGRVQSPPIGIDSARWSLVWEGARPGDRRERFWLYIEAGTEKSDLAARRNRLSD